eukprot:Em0012g1013a
MELRTAGWCWTNFPGSGWANLLSYYWTNLPPPGGVQPYGQPVVYYFDPGSGPVTQAPPPTARTDIVNPDDVITDYFVFVFVIAILCATAAFPSILLGMPALFLAIKSRQFKTAGSYKMSQRYSVMSYYFGLGTVILGGAIFTIWVCILLWHRAFKPLF